MIAQMSVQLTLALKIIYNFHMTYENYNMSKVQNIKGNDGIGRHE